jgi:hypothetical protein
MNLATIIDGADRFVARAQVLTMTVEVKKFPAARGGSGRSLSGSSTAITTVTAIS